MGNKKFARSIRRMINCGIKNLQIYLVFPVLGDTNDVSTWISIAKRVNVIIDATSEYNDPTKHTKNILDKIIEIK